MEYALDVSNPKVEQALTALGISPDELLKKNYEDFLEPKAPEEIAQLRFDYHLRRMDETVRKVKSKMKHLRVRPIHTQESVRSMTVPETLETVSVDQLKLKYSKAIRLAYQEQKAKTQTKSVRQLKPAKPEEEVLHRANSVKAVSHTDRFLERSKKLKADYDEHQAKLQKHLMKTMAERQAREAQLIREKHEQHRAKELEYIKRQQELEMQRQENELVLSQKAEELLQSLEDRLYKSQENHQLALKETAEKASLANKKAIEICEIQKQQLNQIDKDLLIKVQSKIEQARWRRSKLIKGDDSKKSKLKNQTYLDRLEKTRLEERKKAIELERKIEKDNQGLSHRHQSWNHKLMIRRELQRLKYEDLILKAQRAKRIQASKQFLLLKKHMEDAKRIEEFKTMKDKKIEMNRKIASLDMLEREKFRVAREILQKTSPAKASALLKEYNLGEEKAEGEGDEGGR